MKMKATLLAAMLACTSATAFAMTPVQTNSGDIFYDFSEKQYENIQWEKPVIRVNDSDSEKIARIKESGILGKDFEKKANELYQGGLGGDFLSIRQTQEGKIHTQFGDFSILWSQAENEQPQAYLCRDDVCAKDLSLKRMDKVSGVLYGKMGNLLPETYQKNRLKEDDSIGLVRVKIRDFFRDKPKFHVETKNLNDMSVVHHVSVVNEYKLFNDQDVTKKVMQLDDQNGTKFAILRRKGTATQVLSLNDDKTRIYTRYIDDNTSELFYVDFDNEKVTNKATIVNIARIERQDF